MNILLCFLTADNRKLIRNCNIQPKNQHKKNTKKKSTFAIQKLMILTDNHFYEIFSLIGWGKEKKSKKKKNARICIFFIFIFTELE